MYGAKTVSSFDYCTKASNTTSAHVYTTVGHVVNVVVGAQYGRGNW